MTPADPTKQGHLGIVGFFAEVKKEMETQSDRGLVIVGASGLEPVLEMLLRSSLQTDMTDGESAALFEFNGPLGSFSAKIDLGRALGCITSNERRELHLVRKIRNCFAHQMGVSFADPTIRNLCRELKLSERLYAPNDIISLDPSTLVMPDANSAPRDRFAGAIYAMFRVLHVRVLGSRDVPAGPSDFGSPEELEQAILDASRAVGESLMDSMQQHISGMAAIGRQMAAQGEAAMKSELDTSAEQHTDVRNRLSNVLDEIYASYESRIHSIKTIRGAVPTTGSPPPVTRKHKEA